MFCFVALVDDWCDGCLLVCLLLGCPFAGSLCLGLVLALCDLFNRGGLMGFGIR